MKVRLLRFSWGLPVAIGAVLAILPFVDPEDILVQRDIELAAIYALLTVGFNLAFGFAGELALGQVAVFAGGAYVAAILNLHGNHELSIAILLAILVAAGIGVIAGVPGLLLSHWTLALMSFFLLILIPDLTDLFKDQTKGLLGIPGILQPTLFGVTLSPPVYHAFAVGMAALVLLLYRNLVMSRYGQGLHVLKAGPQLTRSLGMSPFNLRMSAYILGSLPAGVAGVFFAYFSTYVEPTAYNFDLVTLILAASVVGGTTSIWGAAIGAGILVVGPEKVAAFRKYSVIAYGVFLAVAGLGLAAGLGGLGRALLARFGWLPPRIAFLAAPSGGRARLAIPGETLKVAGVDKSFGGVQALKGVDFEARPGRITGVIGANGAGKTTMLNAISGLISVDAGDVRLGETIISRLPTHKIARAGVSRTFQTPQIPEELCVLEVAASGRFAKNRVLAAEIAFRTPRYRRFERDDVERARSALAFVGLEDEADTPALKLPLGRRRILEVARSIAAEPSVVLLDEPAAGLDPEALQNLRSVLVRMRDAGATVVLVEHNVTFVMDIADDVFVMDLGSVIAHGAPEEVRQDEKVIASYLGRRAKTHHTADETEEPAPAKPTQPKVQHAS